MAQTTVSIRMDENVKKQFDAFCNEIGVNTSVAVNFFAKAVLRGQRIPSAFFYSKNTVTSLDR